MKKKKDSRSTMDWLTSVGSLYLQFYQWGGPLTTGLGLLSPTVGLVWWAIKSLRWRALLLVLLTAVVAGYLIPVTYYWVHHGELRQWTEKDYMERCKGMPYTVDFILLCTSTRAQLGASPWMFAHSKLGHLYFWLYDQLNTAALKMSLYGTLLTLGAGLMARYAGAHQARKAFDSFHGGAPAP